MKPLFIVFLFFTISFTGNTQSFEVWGSAGAKYKLNKKIQFSGSFSSRFRDLKAKTIFPQLTVKYKIVKWVNVSIDYRYVAKRENNGNYIGANRVNMNAKFNYNIDRFSLGFRTRYQMSSEKGSSSSYNSDFDRAIRFKPSLAYDIKKSIFRIKQSKSKYLMATSFVNIQTNSDILTANWRPINLEKKPFNFPEPIITINEECEEMDRIYSDKCICLWEIEELPDFFTFN